MRFFPHSALILVAGCVIASGQNSAVVRDSSDHIAERIVNSKIPVLIDFWAPWCMPCHMVSPIVTEIKKTYAGRVLVMKINIDVHRRIAAHFKVRAIPAVFIVKDRTVVKSLAGVQDKEVYVAAVEHVLAAAASPPDSSRSGTHNQN